MTDTHATPEPMIVHALSQAQSVIIGENVAAAYAKAAVKLPEILLIGVEIAAFQAGQLHALHVERLRAEREARA